MISKKTKTTEANIYFSSDNDFSFAYTLYRSAKRRTICAEIDNSGSIAVRVPFRTSEENIHDFILKEESWFRKHISRAAEINSSNSAGINNPHQTAQDIIMPKLQYYSDVMRLYPNNVKITSAKKRFGSCSYYNNICFSKYLIYYPDEFIDYVIVHELAHIVYKNHSKSFYKLIEQYIPGYREILKQSSL
jgi:predicted metal-dependent hydrolase